MKNRLTLLRPSLTLYMIFKIYESRWVPTGLNKSSFGTISTINEVFSTWVHLVARTILLLFNCPNYCPKAVSWPIVYVINFILIFHVFFKFRVYVPIFSGLGFNFRVKWFMGLCPFFYFFRVKLNMGLCT